MTLRDQIREVLTEFEQVVAHGKGGSRNTEAALDAVLALLSEGPTPTQIEAAFADGMERGLSMGRAASEATP